MTINVNRSVDAAAATGLIGIEWSGSTSVPSATVTPGGSLTELDRLRRAEDAMRTWHPARRLATPGIPLRIELSDGRVVDGQRPGWIRSYDERDLGYRDDSGAVLLDAVAWAVR